MNHDLPSTPSNTTTIDDLVGQLRTLIQVARQQVLRAVDTIQVQTCWEIGRHIV